MEKYLFGHKNWNKYYEGTFFEVRWINDTLTSGHERHDRAFWDIIGGLRDGTVSLDIYPGLEIYYRTEFDGTIIEHILKPYPANPSLMTMEIVYRSSVLSGE